MDAKTLFLSINNLTKSILLCYRKLCVLDFQGKSASVEYEKLLKLVDTLTELEDYYYSFIFNADNNLKDAFMDELLGLYNISQLKLISSGEWYLLFNEVSDEILCGFRIINHMNSVFSRRVLDGTGCPNEAVKSYAYSVEKRKQIFLDSVRELCESGECGIHKKEMYSSLYDFAFIYKKDNSVEKSEFPAIVGNGKDIETIVNLSNKMLKLNEKSVNSNSNFRKISLNICYIKSILAILPKYLSNNIIESIDQNSNVDRNSFGYKMLLSIFNVSNEVRDKYNDDGFTLKRKI